MHHVIDACQQARRDISATIYSVPRHVLEEAERKNYPYSDGRDSEYLLFRTQQKKVLLFSESMR